MNYRLKDVVEVGDSISYAYDFGSTTELILNIHSCRDGEKKDNEIVILSRNISCQSVIRLEWAYVGMMEVMYILINLSQMKNEVIKMDTVNCPQPATVSLTSNLSGVFTK